MKTVHKISTYLLTVMGLVHMSFTPAIYVKFAFPALWFAAGGMMMIFVGFLNIGFSRGAARDRVARLLCHIANVMAMIFGALAVSLSSEPQVITVFLLLVLMTVTGFMLRNFASVRD